MTLSGMTLENKRYTYDTDMEILNRNELVADVRADITDDIVNVDATIRELKRELKAQQHLRRDLITTHRMLERYKRFAT